MNEWHQKCFYRVSVKALIRNELDQLLLVDEGGDGEFALPGGGWDFGESLHQCLKRELYEEIALDGGFSYLLSGSCTYYNPSKQAHQMLLVCEVEINENAHIGVGVDANTIGWFDKEDLGSDKITLRIRRYLEAYENGKPHITLDE